MTSTSAAQKNSSTPAAVTTASSASNSMKIITTGSGSSSIKTTVSNVNTVSSLPVIGTNGAHVLDLSNIIDTSGLLLKDFQQGGIYYSGNNQISLQIRSGTRGVNVDGTPVQAISIQPGTNVPAPPSGLEIVSPLEFGPSGATFSNPIAVIIEYDTANLNSKNLTFEYYDNQSGKWAPGDYTLDTQNHRVIANISHFSLYSIMTKGAGAVTGIGWSMALIIILTEVILGGVILMLFLQRRPQPRPLQPAAAAVSVPEIVRQEPQNIRNTNIAWDDILPANTKKGAPFKTQLEVIGGKVTLSQNNGSLPLEIVNTGDTRLIVSLEYDPELYPQGNAKIIVLSAEQFEKTKEIRK
jgi:hypothetical protein